jgi:tetratricopeptide (TPR) repeat protein
MAVALVLSFGTAPAMAANKTEREAHRLFLQARDLFKNGRFQDAVDALDKAYTLFPKPIILVKKAESYEKMDLPEEALAAYDRALADEADQKARGRIETAREALVAVLARPIELSVVSNVPSTQVIIDGKPAGLTPLRIELPRGVHAVRGEKDGFGDAEQSVLLKGTKPHVVTLELSERLGQVVISTDRANMLSHTLTIDDATVDLSDAERNSSRTEPKQVRVGNHVVACGFPGYRTYFAPVQVTEGVVSEVACNFAEFDVPPSEDYTWAWVTMSGALAFTGTGVFLVVSYYNDVAQADEQGLGIETSKDDFGIAALAVGGALAGVSLYLFLDPPVDDADTARTDDGPPVHMTLLPLPEGGAFVGAGGSF